MYGSYNSRTNTLDNDELTAANPQTLPAMLQQLANQEHQVLYFGPYSEKQLAKVIGKYHPMPKHPAPAPEDELRRGSADVNDQAGLAAWRQRAGAAFEHQPAFFVP